MKRRGRPPKDGEAKRPRKLCENPLGQPKKKEALRSEDSCLRHEAVKLNEALTSEFAGLRDKAIRLRDETMKLNEALRSEVACMRSKLQQLRDLQFTHLAQLEEGRRLREQLASVQKQNQESRLEMEERRRLEMEEKKTSILELQNQLTDAELKIVEGDRRREELQKELDEILEKHSKRTFVISDDSDTDAADDSYSDADKDQYSDFNED